MRAALVVVVVSCSYESPSSPMQLTDAAVRIDAALDDARSDGPLVTSFVLEAESPATSISADGVHSWVVDNVTAGFTGNGYVSALPDDNAHCADPPALTCGGFNTYNFVIEVAGTYRVFVRHHADSGSTDSVSWTVGTGGRVEDLDPEPAVDWIDDADTTTVDLPIGPAVFGLRTRETATRVDHIRLELQ